MDGRFLPLIQCSTALTLIPSRSANAFCLIPFPFKNFRNFLFFAMINPLCFCFPADIPPADSFILRILLAPLFRFFNRAKVAFTHTDNARSPFVLFFVFVKNAKARVLPRHAHIAFLALFFACFANFINSYRFNVFHNIYPFPRIYRRGSVIRSFGDNEVCIYSPALLSNTGCFFVMISFP